ncbi:polycystin-1-like protein 2 [Watersipora subatra]|uniref:polycystin-1-like protein 2 n=1 Tax=Watersipora subatra TaxID=2589382 RepID=UPI00355B7C3C
MALYLCSLIWASAQDKKDAIKAGVSPLLDNDPRDRYLYEVTVYTGTRTGASTTAKVSIIFSGEEDETPPRLIYDDKRPILQAGGVDGFVMATPRCLGSLSHVRMWHDNSGKSPGWFFSRMQVVDMQTLEKYFFILDRWLSAGEDDGIIDRIVPLAGKDELTGFSHLFFTKARKDLMDGHIWFSIFGKPHKSNFTRVQRLTCCISLLFASMAANIMFYRDPSEADENIKSFRLGPISLTYQQVLTGILSSLVAFPVNLLIVLIYKNTKEPPYDLGKRCCAPCKKGKKKKHDGTFAADELAQQAKILDDGFTGSRAASFASLTSMNGQNEAINEYVTEETKQRNKKYKLPWGFLFVAYILALAVVGGAFYYTVEVAGTFGPKKSAGWTAAFCTSIIESIFMSQPIKVVGIALFWALVIRKPTNDDDVDPGLEKGEEYMHKHEKQCQKLDQQVRKRLNKYKNVPIPPSEEYLTAARALRFDWESDFFKTQLRAIWLKIKDIPGITALTAKIQF